MFTTNNDIEIISRFEEISNDKECNEFLHALARRLVDIKKEYHLKTDNGYNNNILGIKKHILSKNVITEHDFKVYSEVEGYEYQVNLLCKKFGADISSLVGIVTLQKPRRISIVKYVPPVSVVRISSASMNELERNIAARIEQNQRRRAAGLSKAYEYRSD